MHLYDEFLDLTGTSNRKGQRDAVNLLVALSDSEKTDHYAIQAPTGTGKSYAALLAGIHNARKGRRTVIGTSTLVLSDQYADDMARIAESYPDVKFFVLKGASNYYCGNRAAEEIKKSRKDRQATLREELKNAARSRHGRIPFWASADTEYCYSCRDNYASSGETACEYARARAAAVKADVVVTTHAMIAVDMRLRALSKGERDILGEVWLTVFDEAHKAAGNLVYSEVLTAKRVGKLAWNDVLRSMGYARRNDFVEHFENLVEADWYNPDAEKMGRLLELWPNRTELGQMNAAVKLCSEKDRPDFNRYVRFMKKARDVIEELSNGEKSGGVALWVSGTGYKMQDMIPEVSVIEQIQKSRVAWISATIGTASRPTYSLDKCGLKTRFFDLESAFDFSKQMRWAVREEGSSMPQADLLAAINGWVPGGMVVLTGSHRRKERIVETVGERSPGVLVQGQAQGVSGDNGNDTNKALIRAHRERAGAGENPVLVGVEVFGTGIDLPGADLTKLVIAGLYPLRDDIAYSAWRWRWIEAVAGGSGFDGYELPERAIALEQQVGRLIRRETDEGLVVFYVATGDWAAGAKGRKVIEEAMHRFPGAVEL